MKKKESTNKKTTAKSKGSAPVRATLKYAKIEDIIANAAQDDKGNTHVDLVEPQTGSDGTKMPVCTLHIYPTDYDFDNGILDLLGFSIRVQIRAGKNGMFLSFPQEKGKDGQYYDRVTCFDKNFHSTIKAVLGALYDDQGAE